MKRPRLILRLSILALIPIVGIVGLLFVAGGWEIPFLFLTFFPLILGVVMSFKYRKNKS